MNRAELQDDVDGVVHAIEHRPLPHAFAILLTVAQRMIRLAPPELKPLMLHALATIADEEEDQEEPS